MEKLLKEALNTSTLVPTGRGGGGCINQGEAYLVDSGTVFVKSNKKQNAKLMFEGELQGLKSIEATNTLRVPKPIVVVNNPSGGASLVMEYLDMKSLRTFSPQLGTNLARMHLQNIENITDDGKIGSEDQQIKKFGFHTTTCCGYIPMNNTWNDDWVKFYARNRLEYQIKAIEKDFGDRELIELWSNLQLKLPNYFKDMKIQPSLLHGDLWGGNVAETCDEPIVFDCAAFYGHHEYELAISKMFGGFNKSFFTAYHKLIPETHGFKTRSELYQLFHYLNHWNHFGAGYRRQTIQIMESLVKK